MTVHLGSHVDETGAIANWHINKAHYLESWSDARAYDGTISIIQPMIDPMYGGKSAHDVLQTLLENPQISAYDAVVRRMRETTSRATSPRAGARRCTMAGLRARRLRRRLVARARARWLRSRSTASSGLEISFRPDPSLYDGRFANVGWLQELPKQVTNLSWDNAAMMSMDDDGRAEARGERTR